MHELLLPQVVAPRGVYEDSVIPLGGGVVLRAVGSDGVEVARMTVSTADEYELAHVHLKGVLEAWETRQTAPAGPTKPVRVLELVRGQRDKT